MKQGYFLPDEKRHKITAVETAIPSSIVRELLLVRLHTDSGVLGFGETYYAPETVASFIHEWMAPRLIHSSALTLEAHWRFFYERFGAFGGRGAEIRALSAIDLALWDILGKVCQQPVWQLMGGKVRDCVPVYNSCGGPGYGAGSNRPSKPGRTWPGYGDPGEKGPLQDYWRALNSPVELAQELLETGYRAMKVWTLDEAAHRNGGRYISWQDLADALAPLEAIRERLGFEMELMLDGHGFFNFPAALRIAGGAENLQLMWVEDLLKPDSIDTLAEFRRKVRIPVAASEMFSSTEEYRLLVEKRATDYVMIDPTWVGGISQTFRLAQWAQTYNLPVLMHDCTGPLTLMAGLQMGSCIPGVVFQETVRAHIQSFYRDLIDLQVEVVDGATPVPARPGLGAGLNPDLFREDRPHYRLSGKL